MTLTDPVAKLQQLREPMPTFGVKTFRRSIEVVAEQALEVDDEETRELAASFISDSGEGWESRPVGAAGARSGGG